MFTYPLLTSAPGLGTVRAYLEHSPRRKFAVSEASCAAAVAYALAPFYLFPGPDGRGTWWALRRDGQPAVRAGSPGELCFAVMADFAAHPVVPR